MDKNESTRTLTSSMVNSFNINKTFADETTRIRIFLFVADEELAAAVREHFEEPPQIELALPSYIRVRELIEQCLSQFNEDLQPLFRLTENAEFYQLFMAKKKTG